MKRFEFIIPEPILGYRQTTKKSMFHKDERARSKAYGQFKEKVRIFAVQRGFVTDGVARKAKPPRLSVEVFWRTEPRVDWKNVYGGIEDALWHEWDRHVIPGKFSNVHWDSGREEVRVIVEMP